MDGLTPGQIEAQDSRRQGEINNKIRTQEELEAKLAKVKNLRVKELEERLEKAFKMQMAQALSKNLHMGLKKWPTTP